MADGVADGELDAVRRLRVPAAAGPGRPLFGAGPVQRFFGGLVDRRGEVLLDRLERRVRSRSDAVGE
ncbi:hypothetical protein AB0D10_03940 [Kitasatospora sp. NPDC048545]|uniref:hypothetical protein n=1 Tax=Kitasatospora sp. NPDC048545 TaxID=3157208 RepID=UPI0033DFA614